MEHSEAANPSMIPQWVAHTRVVRKGARAGEEREALQSEQLRLLRRITIFVAVAAVAAD